MNNTTPYSEGNTKTAKLILIGEAPARNEMIANRPFVGPSGKVLDRCLHSAQISRSEPYITNVFDRPIQKVKGEIPLPTEEDYLRLVETFKEFREDAIIIPLGGTSSSLIAGHAEILKYRGSPLPCTFEQFNQTVIPTIHPAATLHGTFLWQYFIISDLKKAKRWSLGNGAFPEKNFLVGRGAEESIEYLRMLEQVDQYAWDIEIWNNQISCISFAPNPDEAISIPLIDMHKPNRSFFTTQEEAYVWKALAKTLGADNFKMGQNLMFDASWMYHFHHIIMRGDIGDTMLAHHIMYPDFPKGLDFLCSIYTDGAYYKEDRKLWKKFGGDQERFWRYNARDSTDTFEVWNALQKELEEYRETYDMTLDLFYPLVYTIEKGAKVDKERLAETKVRMQVRRRELEEELRECSEVEFNPDSPKQCREYFYETKGIKPYINRSTGKISCDDKALQRLATTHKLQEAAVVQKIRKIGKLLGTYLQVGLDDDSVLRSFYNPRGTVTGRLSSSQTLWGTGLNMQNLHTQFKGFIVAPTLEDLK